MSWFKVEDSFADHPKFLRVGPLGIALWLAGLAYCSRNLTDGFIPRGKLPTLMWWEYEGPTEERRNPTRNGVTNGVTNAVSNVRAQETISRTSGFRGEDIDSEYVSMLLVEAELWEETDEGFWVHDYLEYQASREQVTRKRESTNARVAKHRNAVTNADVTHAQIQTLASDSKEEKEKAKALRASVGTHAQPTPPQGKAPDRVEDLPPGPSWTWPANGAAGDTTHAVPDLCDPDTAKAEVQALKARLSAGGPLVED